MVTVHDVHVQQQKIKLARDKDVPRKSVLLTRSHWRSTMLRVHLFPSAIRVSPRQRILPSSCHVRFYKFSNSRKRTVCISTSPFYFERWRSKLRLVRVQRHASPWRKFKSLAKSRGEWQMQLINLRHTWTIQIPLNSVTENLFIFRWNRILILAHGNLSADLNFAAMWRVTDIIYDLTRARIITSTNIRKETGTI